MKSQLTPHITEKTYRIIEESAKTGNTYTFKVEPSLTKELVKKFVEREYKVIVESVNMVKLPGKVRRFKGIVGKTSSFKKAIVRLKKGDSISAFDVEDKDKSSKE